MIQLKNKLRQKKPTAKFIANSGKINQLLNEEKMNREIQKNSRENRTQKCRCG